MTHAESQRKAWNCGLSQKQAAWCLSFPVPSGSMPQRCDPRRSGIDRNQRGSTAFIECRLSAKKATLSPDFRFRNGTVLFWTAKIEIPEHSLGRFEKEKGKT